LAADILLSSKFIAPLIFYSSKPYTMPFFDFHIHPVLKSQFTEKTATTEKFSPWEKVRRQDIPFMMRWCSEFEYILESQASLSQLIVNECNLICAVLYISEIAMIDNSLIRDAARTKLKRYLQEARINKIINSNPYQLLLNDDLKTLTDAAQFGVTDRKVKLITKKTDYNEADTDTIHVVFTLEGLHTLCNGLRNYNKNTIIANLDDLRSRHTLISVNPTHIEQSPICNHAFAMPFLSAEIFKPTGNRIHNDGIDIIRHCYQNNILIDIKHMSLAARLHLYQLRQFNGFGPVNPPLVCTHAGFTGISVNDIPDYIIDYKRPPGKKYTRLYYGKPVVYQSTMAPASFNPCSINLYNEDILEIINSGGMIGLSVDKRILGYQNYEPNSPDNFPMEEEYVSHGEEDLFLPTAPGAEVGNAVADGKCVTWQEVKDGGIVQPNAGFQHLRHFMAHVLHLIVVAGPRALKQVCIGSDFDGLINPIWCCETTDDIFHFKQDFKDHFENFAEDSDVSLPAGFDITNFCEDLFFRNGRDFIMKRLEALHP
jgi:microsomal dipeptidase-like Zn-dependent dipeptidase